MYNKDIEFKFSNKVAVFTIREGGISWIDGEKMNDTIHFEYYRKSKNGELTYINDGIFYNMEFTPFRESIEKELNINYRIAFERSVPLKSVTFKKIYNKCMQLKKQYSL